MFKLEGRGRRGSVSFLFRQARNLHYNAPLGLINLMANLIFSHQYPSLFCDNGAFLSSPFLRKLVYSNAFRSHRSIGFPLRSCFGNDSSFNDVFHKAKARAFATPPHPRVIADLENIGLINEACDSSVNTRLLNQSPTKPRAFPDHPSSQKIVVAVDIDEVLGNFVSALNRFIADRYSSNYSVAEYYVYEFFRIWNCSRDEADMRVHEFFKTTYFKSGIYPIPGAQMALQKLSRFCNLSIVTSRQNAIKDHTIEWIEKNYPRLFQEIHFGNHFALDGISRPKSEICRSLGAKVLIDDNPRYAMECAEVGIRVLLFDYENSYPWSKNGSAEQHPLVTRVHNWEEVEQQLMSWIVS